MAGLGGVARRLRAERQWAGVVLLRMPVLLAAPVLAVALTASALLALGLWRPAVALPLLLLPTLAAVGVTWRLRVPPVPVWTACSLVGCAVAAGVWAGVTHSEQVVLRRDAGSLALFAQWIATRGVLPVDADPAAFGTALHDPAVTLASPAFYQVGDQVVPQFLVGAPAIFSLGYWAGGWNGLLLVPAVLMAVGVLTVGSLAARLVGPAWSVLASTVLPLTQPMLHAARSTYSELPSLVLLAAGTAVLTDALQTPAQQRPRWQGACAGLLIGGSSLVRVDALREVIVALPVAAVLVRRRHPVGAPFAVGAGLGVALGAAVAVSYSRPYLSAIAGSLLPLLGLTVLVLAGCAAVVRPPRRRLVGRFGRRRPLRATWARLPRLTWLLVLGTGALLASRPWWLTVRQSPREPGSRVVAGLQAEQHLPEDGGRTYAEDSLTWVAWYVGWPTVALAVLSAAGLAARLARCLRDRQPVPPWAPALVLALGSSLLTLYRPGITPDHPWADRRLVPVVLPAFVLLATAAGRRLAAVVPRHGGRFPRRWTQATTVAIVLVLLGPAAVGTAPLAGQRTERGELAAVRAVCRELAGDDVVLAVDSRAANEWPQVVRGVCGRPAASLRWSRTATVLEQQAIVRRVADAVRLTGRHPVLLAASDGRSLSALGLPGRQVVDLRTIEDQRLLERRPEGDRRLLIHVWLASAG